MVVLKSSDKTCLGQAHANRYQKMAMGIFGIIHLSLQKTHIGRAHCRLRFARGRKPSETGKASVGNLSGVVRTQQRMSLYLKTANFHLLKRDTMVRHAWVIHARRVVVSRVLARVLSGTSDKT